MAHRRRYITRNIRLLYITSFLSNFRLNAPILIIYLQQQAGSLTAALSLLSILMLGASILDIPTGALADIFSRKYIILLGWVFGLVHLSLLAIGGSYLTLLLSMLAASVGMALGSGANTALLYDSLRELQREEDYKKTSGRINALLTLALGVAAPLGSYLATITLSLPFWIQLIPQCIGIFMTVLLTEPLYHKSLQNTVITHSLRSAKAILANKQLFLLLFILSLSFASGETVAAIAPKWYQMNIPLSLIGIAFTAAYVISALGFFLAASISTKFGDTPVLFICTLYTIVVTLIATLFAGPLSVVLAVSAYFFYGVRWPILDALINRQISSDQRATIGSFGGVLQRFTYAVFALLFGMLADRLGLLQAIRVSALVLTANALCIVFLKSLRPNHIHPIDTSPSE